MKLFSVVALALATASASPITVASADAQVTDAPLQKRYKEKIVNKDYKHLQSLKEHGTDSASETQKPWIRTIYGSKVEIVTPTVVAGVTFSAKPPKTTNGLEPWVSLNKDGSPKTIQPKMKNGNIEKKSPDYSTWFQTATTVIYNKEELKAHNMKDDEIYEHVEMVEEDLTYRSLNPILRCTPEGYGNKGLAKDVKTEPFCFPRDNSKWYVDKTYFVTWYSRYFDESVKNVRVHLSYVKESVRQKGTKRDLSESLDKRSSVMEKGGSLGASFFTSPWISKDEGLAAIDIDGKWLENDFYRKVLISVQPDNVDDEEHNHLDKFVVVEVLARAKVGKGSHQDIKEQEEKEKNRAIYGDDYDVEEGLDYDKYMVILTMPACVMVMVLLMYAFVMFNRRDHDLSFLKQVKFTKKKSSKLPFRKKNKYTELPQWEGAKAD